jgi:hypothetical protein
MHDNQQFPQVRTAKTDEVLDLRMRRVVDGQGKWIAKQFDDCALAIGRFIF